MSEERSRRRDCYDIETFSSLLEVKHFLNANKISKENVISITTEEFVVDGMRLYDYKLLYVLETQGNK